MFKSEKKHTHLVQHLVKYGNAMSRLKVWGWGRRDLQHGNMPWVTFETSEIQRELFNTVAGTKLWGVGETVNAAVSLSEVLSVMMFSDSKDGIYSVITPLLLPAQFLASTTLCTLHLP